jgi:hypothetical protein
MERRTKRSECRTEALQYLVETVADRSKVRALVLVDDDGRILAGMGPAGDLGGLATAAIDVAWQRVTPATLPSIGASNDVTARAVATREGMLYLGALGALGDRVAGVGDAVRAVQRIVVQTAPAGV